jgi:hypothetical protein
LEAEAKGLGLVVVEGFFEVLFRFWEHEGVHAPAFF